METGTNTQVLDLYKALQGSGSLTGTERVDVLAIFDQELSQAMDAVAQAKDAAATQAALAKQDPQAAAAVLAEDPDMLPSLIGSVDDFEKAATDRLDALKTRNAISIGDMFQMQLLMNHLSGLSEMTTSVVSASNSAIKSMAQNVRG
jgi:tRNA A37 N6-isopentenylltransferase MiaA